MKKVLSYLLLLLLILVPNGHAQEEDLEFSLKPYLWLPSIDGSLKYTTLPGGSSGSPQISAGPDAIFKNFDFGVIMASELRKGKWSIFSDFIYLKLSAESTTVDAINFGGTIVSAGVDTGSEVEFQQFLTTAVVGYEIINNEDFNMDIIAGLRYLWIEAELKWSLAATITGPLGGGQTFARTGQFKEDVEVWNGVGGVRGRVNLGDGNWYIPYYADVGAGDSDLTWQLFTALGYSFDKWDVGLGYRHLVFEASGDSIIDNISMSGPILGASYNF